MSATCFTYTDFDAIKMFRYFRHFQVTKLGKILLTSKEISAKSKQCLDIPLFHSLLHKVSGKAVAEAVGSDT